MVWYLEQGGCIQTVFLLTPAPIFHVRIGKASHGQIDRSMRMRVQSPKSGVSYVTPSGKWLPIHRNEKTIFLRDHVHRQVFIAQRVLQSCNQSMKEREIGLPFQ